MFFLYILKSENVEKYYIGISQNPERRLEYHNTIEKGFTSRYRPWKLVHKIHFYTKSDAMKAEKKIKSWKSKAMIEKVINGDLQI